MISNPGVMKSNRQFALQAKSHLTSRAEMIDSFKCARLALVIGDKMNLCSYFNITGVANTLPAFHLNSQKEAIRAIYSTSSPR